MFKEGVPSVLQVNEQSCNYFVDKVHCFDKENVNKAYVNKKDCTPPPPPSKYTKFWGEILNTIQNADRLVSSQLIWHTKLCNSWLVNACVAF
jgi:hypothetical protein